MSSEDADDERDTPAVTPVQWIDSRHQSFTIFVVLPSEEVCTLRDLPSGITAFDLKGKLELVAGLPSQIYSLMYPDGEEILDDQRLLVRENIQNGYLLKMQLLENWESLYMAVIKNNIEHMYHGCGVHLKGNIKLHSGDANRIASVVRERGSVALFLASFLGLHRMVNMLVSVDVDVNQSTPFGRTPLHAAAARDQLGVLDLLLKHGASIRRTDCYGFSAVDVAKDMSSDQCAKRFRVLLLNLRGGVGQNTSRDIRSGTSLSDKKSASRFDLPNMPSRSNTVGEIQTHSTLSQMSEDMTHYDSVTPSVHRHKRLTPASTVLSDASSTYLNKQNHVMTSVPTTVLKSSSDPKKLIKWKDAPTGNTYWQVIELDKGHNRIINKAMAIKPIALLQQTKVLKFDRTRREPTVPPGSPVSSRGLEENMATPRESIFTKYNGGGSASSKSVRFSNSRSNQFRTSRQKINNQKTMRRKIKIAADNSRAEELKQNSEAFERWLAKKREEAERSEDDDNDVSEDETDDEEDKLREFNKRVRKMNIIERRTLTPGNRPVPDVIDVGKRPLDENIVPSPHEHITAHKEYLMRKRMGQRGVSRSKAGGDITTEKRMLEERRQRLLYSAITYDEWLDHSEERKQLINRILKANLEEMKKIEEEKFNYRIKHFKYEDWKEKAEKRETEERKRRAREKKWEEEGKASRFYVSSIAPTFDDWVKSKKKNTEKDNLDNSLKKNLSKPTRKPGEIDTAYDNWLVKKHKEEMDRINSHGYHVRILTVR